MRRRTRPSRRAVRVGSVASSALAWVFAGAVTVGGREHMLVVMSRYFFLGVGGVVVLGVLLWFRAEGAEVGAETRGEKGFRDLRCALLAMTGWSRCAGLAMTM